MNGLSRGAIPLGTFWGIRLGVHWVYVAWIAFRLFSAERGRLGDEGLIQLVLFVSVLLHELGHCAGARWVGGEAKQIVLWPLGGLAAIRHPSSPKGEFVSTAAGPAVNLALGLIALGALLVLPQTAGFSGNGLNPYDETGLILFLEASLGLNLILFAFNVIPAFPLDGGKIFRAILWAIPPVSWRAATLVIASIATLIGLVCVGIAPFAPGGLGGMLFFALIGGFIVVSSFVELLTAKQHRSLPPLDDDLMPFERT